MQYSPRTCSGAGNAETPGYQWGRNARDGSPGQDPTSELMKHFVHAPSEEVTKFARPPARHDAYYDASTCDTSQGGNCRSDLVRL